MLLGGAPFVNLPNLPSEEHPGSEVEAYVFLQHEGTWFESQRLSEISRFHAQNLFGTLVALSHELAAVMTHVNEPITRPRSKVIAFDRVGAELTSGRDVLTSSEDSRVADIDVSDRRLVIGVASTDFNFKGQTGQALLFWSLARLVLSLATASLLRRETKASTVNRTVTTLEVARSMRSSPSSSHSFYWLARCASALGPENDGARCLHESAARTTRVPEPRFDFRNFSDALEHMSVGELHTDVRHERAVVNRTPRVFCKCVGCTARSRAIGSPFKSW
jgi:hypothetical protein